ncbi:MAG: helix-turn-helix transcriptional regulator [Rhodopirellula sp.]|nr:helix-turn-helix transcriptional regulator [Rhodopirellula sp.]
MPTTLPLVAHGKGHRLRLRDQLGMNRETFARLVPMSTRNLANIEAGAPPSPNVLRQLQQLRRLVDALAEVIQKDALGPWLEQPNGALDGLKPIEVIERGEVDRIWQMIHYLRSGVPS